MPCALANYNHDVGWLVGLIRLTSLVSCEVYPLALRALRLRFSSLCRFAVSGFGGTLGLGLACDTSAFGRGVSLVPRSRWRCACLCVCRVLAGGTGEVGVARRVTRDAWTLCSFPFFQQSEAAAALHRDQMQGAF
eukprot:3645692-Prymnesium_polylepis.1